MNVAVKCTGFAVLLLERELSIFIYVVLTPCSLRSTHFADVIFPRRYDFTGYESAISEAVSPTTSIESSLNILGV